MALSKKQVLIGSGLVFVGIIGFDVYLYSDGTPGNSISQAIIYYSREVLLIPWFIGFLMGFLAAHFFDSYTEPRDDSENNGIGKERDI